MPRSSVADEYLRQAIHARAMRIAQTMGVPLDAILIDLEDGAWDGHAPAGRTRLVGDADGLLLHVVTPRCTATERSRYVDGLLAHLVADALAPFALA